MVGSAAMIAVLFMPTVSTARHDAHSTALALIMPAGRASLHRSFGMMLAPHESSACQAYRNGWARTQEAPTAAEKVPRICAGRRRRPIVARPVHDREKLSDGKRSACPLAPDAPAMKSRWEDDAAEALVAALAARGVARDLALRVYSSRL